MPHDLMTRCEQKKEFRINGQDSWKWVEVAASDVANVPRERIRCMHCHGAVRLHQQQVSHGPLGIMSSTALNRTPNIAWAVFTTKVRLINCRRSRSGNGSSTLTRPSQSLIRGRGR
jgi:hypothetical protein